MIRFETRQTSPSLGLLDFISAKLTHRCLPPAAQHDGIQTVINFRTDRSGFQLGVMTDNNRYNASAVPVRSGKSLSPISIIKDNCRENSIEEGSGIPWPSSRFFFMASSLP